MSSTQSVTLAVSHSLLIRGKFTLLAWVSSKKYWCTSSVCARLDTMSLYAAPVKPSRNIGIGHTQKCRYLLDSDQMNTGGWDPYCTHLIWIIREAGHELNPQTWPSPAIFFSPAAMCNLNRFLKLCCTCMFLFLPKNNNLPLLSSRNLWLLLQ